MSIILPYMVRSGEQTHVTESYVSVPPALCITDEQGANVPITSTNSTQALVLLASIKAVAAVGPVPYQPWLQRASILAQ